MRQMVVDVNPVESSKAPKLKRKTRVVKGDAHAFANSIDECFCATIAILLVRIRRFLLDLLLEKVSVDGLCEVFAGVVGAQDFGFEAGAGNDALKGWEKGVLGLVEFQPREAGLGVSENGNVAISAK